MTLVYRGNNILRGFDEDVRKHVRSEMEKSGVNFITSCTINRVERGDGDFIAHLSNGSAVVGDQVMFAIGRHPHVAGLGLEAAGVELSPESGGIAIDDQLRTNVPHIYAVGDVTHRTNLTPVAIREGHAFADRLFGKKSVVVDYSDIPTAVFCQPQVGTVGLTEEVARERFQRVEIFKSEFRPMKATLSGSFRRVLMKLVVDGDLGSRPGVPYCRP